MPTGLPRGRGRLSSIDILPEAAADDVTWAWNEIRKRKLTQEEILEQFNLRLRLKGIAPISRSAFNRAAIRTTRLAHRMGEVREIASALATKFEDGADEQLTMLAAETIKMMVFEILENSGKMRADPMTAEMMANFALAVKSAEQAKKVSADTAVVINKNFRKAAEEAIERAAVVKGLTPEMKDAFRRELFGLPK